MGFVFTGVMMQGMKERKEGKKEMKDNLKEKKGKLGMNINEKKTKERAS